MPATYFICPNGSRVGIEDCLNACIYKTRCMFLPTLRAIAQASNRDLSQPSVTELISGTMESYLKRTTYYAVNPQDQIYALHGSAAHTINQGFTDGNILTEERLYDDITSGQFDLYGNILSDNQGVLGDIKVTSSYKLMKALGLYKVDKFTGEYYKTGSRKGEPKTIKELRSDGVKWLFDWAIQLNYYRILLEKHGFEVKQMVIQAICRDNNTRIAAERGIDKSVYLMPIKKISDHWINKYMHAKHQALINALKTKTLPSHCSTKERWNDRKCLDYCSVAEYCPHGCKVKNIPISKVVA